MPCNESSRGRDFSVESDGEILRFSPKPVRVNKWVFCTKPVRVMKMEMKIRKDKRDLGYLTHQKETVTSHSTNVVILLPASPNSPAPCSKAKKSLG